MVRRLFVDVKAGRGELRAFRGLEPRGAIGGPAGPRVGREREFPRGERTFEKALPPHIDRAPVLVAGQFDPGFARGGRREIESDLAPVMWQAVRRGEDHEADACRAARRAAAALVAPGVFG